MESEKPTTDNGADGNRRASVARAEGVTIRQQVKTALVGGAAERETRRAVLALALPLVGSDLLQRGVNVVDALLVGRLGAAELAAVGLSQLLLMFVMALVSGSRGR
jgi:Na+-driven multidrug efflux pump